MKKQLLPLVLSLMAASASAQVCNPDPSFTNAGPGVYPISIATPDCSDTLGVKTIVSITDTTVHVTNPITLDVTIYYDSSRVVSVSGLPTGLFFGTDVDGTTSSWAPYGAWINGGSVPNVTPAVGCVYVHGSPAAWAAAQLGGDTGVYVIGVEYDARISQTVPDVSQFGIPNGTWLSEVDPSLGGGTITINVPMDTDPITDLQVPTLSGNSAVHLSIAETYTANTGQASYNWTVVGGTIQSGQGTNEITVLWDGGVAEGTVTVEVGDGEGCTKSQIMAVDIAGLGIYEADGLNVSVYPNPSNGQITVEMENSGVASLSMLDLSGKLVHSEQFSGSNHRMDVSHIGSGLYLLKLETGNGEFLTKFVLE